MDRRRPRVVGLWSPRTCEHAASCGSRTCPCDQLRTSGWEVMLGHWVAQRNQFSSLQSLSRIQLFVIPWTAACQASLSITSSRSLLRLMSFVSVMASNHLILCHPLLLLPSIFPSIRVISNVSALCNRWPKACSFSFSISSSNEYSGLISLGWTGWISLLSKELSRVFSNTTVQKRQFFDAQLSL